MKLFIILTCLFTFPFSAPFAALRDKVDGEYVTVSGKVTETNPHSFVMKTKNNKVLVEVDDYTSWTADGFKVIVGDQVVVNGKVDKDFLEKKSIEAGSVYVKNIDTYFFSNSADEETSTYITPAYSYIGTLPEGAVVDLQGTVTNVDNREFTVDTGFRKVRVDTDEMAYNPLDNIGFSKIKVGDRVRISGDVEDNLFESKKVDAKYVNKLPSLMSE